ncbi:hypothetical protein N0V90_000080 [Kalmusia sp. IMI 367209]|nr:hypothetical protein N0V90_000080 [Kalmusia sp. IMI 367209]
MHALALLALLITLALGAPTTSSPRIYLATSPQAGCASQRDPPIYLSPADGCYAFAPGTHSLRVVGVGFPEILKYNSRGGR